jgi:O-antigen ligase
MRIEAAPGPSFTSVPVTALLGRLRIGLFAIFMSCIGIAFVDPSPYDFLAILTIVLWLATGVRMHAGAVPFIAILVIFTLAKVASLLPFLAEPDSVTWVINSTYLAITGIFFCMVFADETERRLEIALDAYVVSALIASLAGIAGYFNVAGVGGAFSLYGRAMGTFKDPNVFGSFMVPAIVYLTHNLTIGRSPRPVLALGALAILLAGVFLSFSRGSWGATLVGGALCVAMAFVTSRSPLLRRRILLVSIVSALAAATVLAGLLSVDEIAERFMSRAQVTQDYDEGVTGRFGNQMRAIPLLIEEPMGFGPLRFRVIFGLEPHNSYVGAFANAGWAGGFAFFALVLTTGFVGFRLCFAQSPYQRLAQIVWPALLVLFLQGFQIDIDHWRHLYVLMGAIWGLEAARRRWLSHRARHPGAA